MNDTYYEVDRVLYNWEYWSKGHAAVDRWGYQMFVERVFPGWQMVTFIKRNDKAAMALRHNETLFVLPLDDPEDIRDSRRQSFDTAITDSVSGTSAIAMADMMISNNIEAHDFVPPRVALMIEAIVLGAPAHEQDAIRTMMALRGLSQPTGYDHLTLNA